MPGARPLEASARRDAVTDAEVAALRVDRVFVVRRREERAGAGRFREGMSDLNGNEWAVNLHGVDAGNRRTAFFRKTDVSYAATDDGTVSPTARSARITRARRA